MVGLDVNYKDEQPIIEIVYGQPKIEVTIESFGPTGPQGAKGDAFTYYDFTEEQLAFLKGEKGDPFVYSDFTVEQLEGLRGPKGDIGDTGPKGDPFVYEDFTEAQLE